MASKISVVINTLNEEANLSRTINSVKNFADEIIVVDMESDDATVEIAKKLGAKVYSHKKTGYVEPARNFAISKATNEWIFILDADEDVPEKLAQKIKQLLKSPTADYFRIPRKNIIFGKWIEHTLWWPDYQIRFFRKGFVDWGEEIHSIPITKGVGSDLPVNPDFAIVHHNYDFLDQFIERLFRYTKIQAENLLKNGYVFNWADVFKKPSNEFLRRFFEGEGYRDGVHGLILSLLQAFSELMVYIRVWEKQGFKDQEIKKKEISAEFDRGVRDLKWWMRKKFSFWGKFF